MSSSGKRKRHAKNVVPDSVDVKKGDIKLNKRDAKRKIKEDT